MFTVLKQINTMNEKYESEKREEKNCVKTNTVLYI